MRTIFIISIFLMFIVMAIGCSGGSDITSVTPYAGKAVSGNNHLCLGLWRMVADPEAKTLDVIELRDAAMHLNALPFLEPPPLLNLTLEDLQFIGSTEIIADIGLRHPFLGLTEFTGFDVCGVFISNGGGTFGGTSLTYADGDNNTHLLNPDGWTRWWNPDDPNVSYCFRFSLSLRTAYASLICLNFSSAALSPFVWSGWYFMAIFR